MRDSSIDIAKGIGIILIVLGHLPYGVSPAFDRGTNFVYLFHVPLFFFLSGMFFKEGENWGKFIKKKFKRLYLPYVIASLIFLAIHIISTIASGNASDIVPVDMCKHAIKICLLVAGAPLGFQLWFLPVLLYMMIIHKALDDFFGLISKNRTLKMALMSLAVICLAIWGYSMRLPFMLDRCFVALLFFFLGRISYAEGRYTRLASRIPFAGMAAIALASLAICAFATHPGHPIPADGDWGNPFVFTVVALTGIIMTLAFSNIISKSTCFTKFFAAIGKETMAILIGQFAAFKVIDCIRPGENSALWLLLMLVAGVALPFLAVKAWDWAVAKFRR